MRHLNVYSSCATRPIQTLINSSLLFPFILIDKMTGVEFYNNGSLLERVNFFIHCVRKS